MTVQKVLVITDSTTSACTGTWGSSIAVPGARRVPHAVHLHDSTAVGLQGLFPAILAALADNSHESVFVVAPPPPLSSLPRRFDEADRARLDLIQRHRLYSGPDFDAPGLAGDDHAPERLEEESRQAGRETDQRDQHTSECACLVDRMHACLKFAVRAKEDRRSLHVVLVYIAGEPTADNRRHDAEEARALRSLCRRGNVDELKKSLEQHLRPLSTDRTASASSGRKRRRRRSKSGARQARSRERVSRPVEEVGNAALQ